MWLLKTTKTDRWEGNFKMEKSNQLYHHGIKGQKWGVRRFQKKDGSLTTAGKKRRREADDFEAEAKNMSDQELRTKINRMNLEKRYTDLSRKQGSKALDVVSKTASIGSEGGKIAKDGYKMMDLDDKNVKLAGQGLNVVAKGAAGAKIISRISGDKKAAKAAKTKLEKMSDKELQDVVNRMDMEQRYASLKKETVSRGKMSATEVLDVVGSIVSIGASATAMAVTIYKLRQNAGADALKRGIDYIT